MNEIQLNLARKWRGQNFDQIIGQDLSVKMLKNSLYRGHLFPVYLFWGQRGTGKTSTARVFAAAINCENLPKFQKEPKNCCMPCMQCASCLAMKAGKHPDFIEIDAASHTGVDNVRQIIDSAALLPLLGHKKIYLIDEAHMLSKAAFNALLKILEEPPISALFILATTDQQKIIETVRSRCFQICFKQVDIPVLVEHLQTICAQESIYADQAALSLIAHESEGSVRDAINMLEQIRFAQGRVTKEAVLSLLGHIDDGSLIVLLDILCRHDSARLVQFLHEISLEQFDADYIWRRLVELLRMMVFARYGLTVALAEDKAIALNRLAKKYSLVQLTAILQLFYAHERLFAKTTGKHLLFEMLLLRICSRGSSNNEPTTNPVSQQSAVESCIPDEDIEDSEDSEDDEVDDSEYQEEAHSSEVHSSIEPSCKDGEAQWAAFVRHVDSFDDALLTSIFKHGQYKAYEPSTGCLEVAFAKQFIFFEEWLKNSSSLWQSVLDKIFDRSVILKPQFTDEIAPVVMAVQPKQVADLPESQINSVPVYAGGRNSAGQQDTKQRPWQASQQAPRRHAVDVSDHSLWPKATMVVRHFPGIVRQY
jgi:DNA polymerase-3 subunit gamma/tau